MRYLVFVFSALFSLGFCDHVDDLNAYPFSAVLKADESGNPLYTLHWNFSSAEETITFGVNVSTNGWVGFGISPNGGMTNSDVVIGWVNDDGEVFFHDRFALSTSLPPVDPQQDWILLHGESVNGYTVLQFWRKWVTCDPDDRDRDILSDTSKVVYAWNENDPEGDDENGPIYHGSTNRGAVSLNLLTGVTNPPDVEDEKSFTLKVQNVTIPTIDTTYWCAALELPQEIQQQKQYIHKYSPIIAPSSLKYVHHMLIYICSSLDQAEVGSSAPCFGHVGESVSECRLGTVMAAWAVGGTDFIYPDYASYPLGGLGNPRYIVIEMHYDNPDLDAGMIDSSGMEFFYTNQRREHEAGILTIGHVVDRFMVVPPRTHSHDIIGECSSRCTSDHFPEDGIKIFGNLLHSHVVGRRLTLKLIRDTEQCAGLEELKPVDQNLQYDFDYQQFTVFPNEVTVYPGDTLLMKCNYNTSERESVTLGGESTREEMCLSFVVYYPRMELFLCDSTPVQQAFNKFAESFFPEDPTALLEAWLNGTMAEAEAALNQYIDWTPAAAQGLQESILGGYVKTECQLETSDKRQSNIGRLPNITCPYQAPDLCADRAAGGSATIVGDIIISVVLVAFTILMV